MKYVNSQPPKKRNDLLVRLHQILLMIAILLPGMANGQGVPLPPIPLLPSDKSLNQPTNLNLSWSEVSGAASYALQVSTGSTFAATAMIVNQSNLVSASYALSGLLNNTPYYWRTSATNSSGTSVWSPVRSFTTVLSKPGKPVLGAPVNNAVGQPINVSLKWLAVATAGSYSLQVSTDSLFSTHIVYSQSNLTVITQLVGGLSNNTTYYWRVNAANVAGNGDWSAVNSFSTILATPVLSSPDSGSINQPIQPLLSWNPVPSAISYALQVATDLNFTNFVFNQTGLTSIPQPITGLSYGRTYYWRVNATNFEGTSGWSAKNSFTTVVAAPVSPKLVAPLNQATNQPVSVNFSWSSVSTAASYALQVSTDSTFAGISIYNQSGLIPVSQSVTGLGNSTVYYWRVNATNASGTSVWSNANSFRTAMAAPAPVYPANNAAGQPVSLALSWDDPGDSANTYCLQVCPDSLFLTAIVFKQSGLTSRSQSISGLANNKKYYWRVNATSVLGEVSSWSAKNSFTTVFPAPVTVFPVNGVSNQPVTLTMSWSADAAIVAHNLQVSLDSTFQTIVYSKSGIPTTSQTVGGLANATTYYWRVCGANALGASSEWSSASRFMTTNGGPTPISPVSSVPQTATFQWEALAGTSSYALQISTDSTFATGFVFNQINITTTSQTVTNLAGGTVYFWRVNATSFANGTGVWSVTSRFATITEAPKLSTPVNNATSVEIIPALSWKSIDLANSYSVQVATDSTFTDPMTFTIGKNSHNINGLSYNASYYWRVNATNEGGTSVWSPIYRFTTVVAPPSAPNLSGTSNGGLRNTISIVFSWDPVDAASSYALQVSTDSVFTSLIYNQSGLLATSQVVTGLASGVAYYWRVSAANAGGSSSWSMGKQLDRKEIEAQLPPAYALGNAIYNSSATLMSVAFDVPATSQPVKVRIRIYSISGRTIATLVNALVSPGHYSIDTGVRMGSGVYICAMEAPGYNTAKLIHLVKMKQPL